MSKPDSATVWAIAQAPYAESVCTANEMTNIIIPFRNWQVTLTGYQSLNVVTNNDTQITITYTFDTLENATAAQQAIYQPDSTNNPLSYARQQLMRQIRTTNNIINTSTISVE
jgi:hypothetical protein